MPVAMHNSASCDIQSDMLNVCHSSAHLVFFSSLSSDMVLASETVLVAAQFSPFATSSS